MKQRKKIVAGTVAASLAIGGFIFGRMTQVESVQAGPHTTPTPAIATPSKDLPSFSTLAPQVAPAVVHIKVVSLERADFQTGPDGPPFGFPPSPFGNPGPRFRAPFPFPFPQPQPGPRRGSGSGFIVRNDGLIVTNNHVVEDAKDITVVMADETEYKAELVGRDPKTDLAVLKIEPKGELPVVKLGDSDALRIGEWVLAIGNPFGLSNTVTAGIVSAKGRTIAGPYDNFIQTDASINPGNSGGPLFNQRGEVVGINTAIFSRSGGNIGIGFATPINQAKALIPELEEHGYVTRGWLGVSIQTVTTDLADSLGLGEARGALVADVVASGPADKAGIKRGDVIVAYSGKPVEESSDLPTLVASTRVGNSVPVEVSRRGKTQTIEVTIGELAEERQAQANSSADKGQWGLALRDLRPEERVQADLKDGEGVLVSGVQPGSPAAEANIQAGDVILEVNQTPVGSTAALKQEVDKTKAGEPLLLLLRRADGNSQFASLVAK